jgi:hypothetical protein
MKCPICKAILADDAVACPACETAVEPFAQRALDPDDVLLVVKEFLLSLSASDKVTFFGAGAMFLACFFPWKETEHEGAVLGLMSLGVVVFLLSLGALALVVLRSRHTGRRRDPFVLWLLQLGAIVTALTVCVVYAVAAVDATQGSAALGAGEGWASRPSFGVILAFLACLVAGGGTLSSLKASR